MVNQSHLSILALPYDGTASYRPGTRFGPNAILQCYSTLSLFSPFFLKEAPNMDNLDTYIVDYDFSSKFAYLPEIEYKVQSLVSKGKKLITLGGEHLLTFPVVKTLMQTYPNLVLLHFDAHADLRDSFLGEPLSHATVMGQLVQVYDQSDRNDPFLYQFGIRSFSHDEWLKISHHKAITTETFTAKTFQDVTSSISKQTAIYLSIDLDSLDAAYLPGTGTPECGGLKVQELLECIQRLSGMNVVGADIMELAPHYDLTRLSSVTAAVILRELAVLLSENDQFLAE